MLFEGSSANYKKETKMKGKNTIGNLISRSLDLGIGLFAYSKDKIENVVDELVERGEIKRWEANGVVDDLVQRGAEQRLAFDEYLRKRLSDPEMMKDYVHKDEVQALIRAELQKQKTETDLT